MTDIVGMFILILFFVNSVFLAAHLKYELTRISLLVGIEAVPGVEKLTGDSSKTEKERVMKIFKEG